MDVASVDRTTRVRSGMSLLRLPERAATSHATVSTYEMDRVDPSLDTMAVLGGTGGRASEHLRIPPIGCPRTGTERFADKEVPYLSWSDLTVVGAFLNRTRDWADLEEMAVAGSLDLDQVLGALVRCPGTDDDRITRFRSLAELSTIRTPGRQVDARPTYALAVHDAVESDLPESRIADGVVDTDDSDDRRRTFSRWVRRRRWQLGASVILVAVCLGISFAHLAWYRHGHGWTYPGDIWTTYRGAQFIGWGDFTDSVQYVSTPAAGLLLAPVALIADHFGLTTSVQPVYLPRPTSWLVLGPYMMVLCTTIIFAADQLADRLGLSTGRRAFLGFVEVALLVPTVFAGHPEDVVSLAIALWACTAAIDGHWKRAGWLFGVAVALQPIALLVLLPTLALTTPPTWLKVIWRAATPTVLVMATPLLAAFGQTLRFLHQPNYIWPNHPTPLLPWAAPAGHDLVNTGPLRMICVVLAAGVAWAAYRNRLGPWGVVWCVGLTLTLRVVIEPVLDSYYAWPAVAVLAIAAVRAGGWRAWGSLGLLGFLTAYVFQFRSPWVYWTPIVAALMLVLALTARPLLTATADGLAGNPEQTAPRRPESSVDVFSE